MTLKEKVIQARQDEPNKRAIEIARDFNCSRERVRQLLMGANLATTVPHYIATRGHNRGPRVQGVPIKVVPSRPSIAPIVGQLTSTKVCPRCGSTHLYLTEDINTWDVSCLICGQLVTFQFKGVVKSDMEMRAC